MMLNSTRTTAPAESHTASWSPMISAVLFVALVVAVSCVLWAGSARADDDGGKAVPRQIVAKLKPNATIGAINNDTRYRTRTLDQLLGSKKIYLLQVPKKKNPARVLELMQNDRRIIYAEPNFRTGSPEGDLRHRARPGGEPSAPSSDPGPYTSQYAIEKLNLPAAHERARGVGAVVAVIDTGVQLSHQELRGSLTEARYDFIDDDAVPADNPNGRDDDGDGEADEMVGHGTHVAGIVRLAAPEAKIMPLRALNPDGVGNVFVLAEAINYAAKKGADVVNLSLGASRESDFLEDILENVAEGEEGMPGGVVVVAAAGNENVSTPRYPAAGDDVLAVASVDQEPTKSLFSNYGRWVDVSVPGRDIYSPFPKSQYALWSGTSMATPFVAGLGALLHPHVPMSGVESDDRGEHRVECVAALIQENASSLDATNPDYVGMLGKGHADAGASVNDLRSSGCPQEVEDDD